MHKPWSFYIHTLGCKVNQYESQAIREAWNTLGGTETACLAHAHVVLINSCAITGRGERDTRHAIYAAQRECPEALCILTGCAAQLVASHMKDKDTQRATPASVLTSVSVVVPPRAKACLMQGPWQWQDFITPSRAMSGHIASCHVEERTFPPFGEHGFSIQTFQRTRPVIKVQDGCSHRCTYCIVPLVRGRGISRPAQEVLHEAQALLRAGYTEIMLSGINLHQYGRDFSHTEKQPKDFWELVQLLDTTLAPEWADRARFRISSLEPNQLHSRGLDIFCAARILCPHVHISLQHGSPYILKRMGRGHNRPEAVLAGLERLRTHKALMGVGADILMGFPGEEEAHVQETEALVRALDLNYAHVFPYSSRPGTAAAAFPQQVPHELKHERAARIRQRISTQKDAFLKKLLQEPLLHVVFDGHKKDTENMRYKGLDAHYAPCILQGEHEENVACMNGVTSGIISGIQAVRPVRIDDGRIVCTRAAQHLTPIV